MNYLANNLNLLKKRFPYLYKNLKDITTENDRFPIELSKNGSPTIQVEGIYVHSRFNPYVEAEKFIKSEISNKAGLIIFAGFGLAYHIESFLQTYNNINIIIIEPDISFFATALSARDYSHIIESDRVNFLITPDPESCGILLEKYPEKTVQLIKLRSVYNKDKEFYIKLDRYVQNYISRKEININTLKRFGKLWVRNLAANAGLLSEAPGINRIYGIFDKVPALLIAAGPSLDHVKPYLKELQKKFLIVSVDTSLRACLEEGVEPDFTVVVDPQYWNSRHLDRCHTNKTILLSETSTYPSVFRQIKGKLFLCSTAFPLGLFMEEKTELKGKLKAGGSVATAAWDFCRILSISDIWCTGLDLGFPEKQTHCKGSYFEQRAHWLSERLQPSETFSWHALNDAGLHSVESNSGNKTWTDKRMSLYIRWFEEQMSKYNNINSWNLSEEGIKINGMPRKTIDEALKEPDRRDLIDEEIRRIKMIETAPELKNKLYNTYDLLIRELGNLHNLASKGMAITQLLESLFNNGSNIEKNLYQLSELDNLIMNSVSKDIAGFILQEFVSTLLKDDREKSGEKIISNSFKLYKELFDSTDFHIKLLRKP